MTLPWQGTTPEISTEADSRYETPGGAQNKVNVSQEYLLHLLKLAVTGLSNGSEAAIARYSEPYDITYDWLKDRLDATDRRFSSFNVMDYGAKADGFSNDGLIINTTIDLCASKGGGTVIIPQGIYATMQTIVIKPNVQLLLRNGCVIKPKTNINVIQVKPGSQLDGGYIDFSDVSGFTKSGIYLDGSDQFGKGLVGGGVPDKNLVLNTSIRNIRVSNETAYEGTGIGLYATPGNNFIQFVLFENMNLWYLKNAIDIKCDPHDGTTGASFINANVFNNLVIQGCVNGIIIDGPIIPYECSGNVFKNIQFQTFYNYTKRAVICKGNYNSFDGIIWDYDTPNKDVAFEVTGGSNTFTTNIGRISSNLISDRGENNKFTSNEESKYAVDVVNKVSSFSFNGDQDDYLTFADLRFTVNPSVAPSSGTLSNTFRLDGDYSASWDVPFSVEVDMTANPILYPQVVGVAFNYGEHATNVKIELFYSAIYHTVLDTSVNHQDYCLAFANGGSNITKIKYTLSGFETGKSAIRVSRFFAQDVGKHGHTWLPKIGGTLYGDLPFAYASNGPVLKDTVTGSLYRVNVTNGVLGVTAL